tara:strand:- start:8223 stop:9440 length:1218 start_codon:yes stop_codon:yes gene_type:complete
MSANDRIFYACQGVAIIDHASQAALTSGNMIYGLQSVGVNTNFSLEQAFELGQIEIYENIEGTPDIEVTLEKVLDGHSLIYHMASTGVKGSAAGTGLVNRSKQRCDVRLGIFPDSVNHLEDDTGAAPAEIYMSGMYISSISYSLNSDGSSTESCTLVGNNKAWIADRGGKITQTAVARFDGGHEPDGLGDDTTGSPSVNKALGGVSQKEDVMITHSVFPFSCLGLHGPVKTMVGSGYGNANGLIHAQSVSVSTDFSREDIFELGKKTPYARPAAFPIEVTCDIEVVSISGDFVEATEAGDYDLYLTTASGNNTPDEIIFVSTRNGLGLDLGQKNRLQSVSYGGGDAGGGNATSTFSYVNYNDLDVQNYNHAQGYIGFEALKWGTAAGNKSVGPNGGAWPAGSLGS